jgi:hypothetical protein
MIQSPANTSSESQKRSSRTRWSENMPPAATKLVILALGILNTMCLIPKTDARPVANWNYQQKFERADVVAIGTPIQVDDTKEQISLPGISVGRLNKPSTGLPVIGVNARFAITSIRKGEQNINEITLHYYRLVDPQDASIANAVSLVAFTPNKGQYFLLFLKREADGRYAPLDQTDPEVNSVEPVSKGQK